MAPKAYSYIRFSTPEQLKGDSLRRQMELSEQYCKEHSLVLDDSLKMQDLGLSAYHGTHRDKGALGAFLVLVQNNKIPPGSVLLVESLDRLSREEITEALEQFLAIIRSGIKIVTLSDNREYTKETINANVGELIISLTIMARAHEESRIKAFRAGKTWTAKREKASNGQKKLTAQAPEWLRLSEDRTTFHIIQDRAKVVNRIFDMKLAGRGVDSIARHLNTIPNIWKPNKVDSRRKGNGWRGSYVRRILSNRAVLGEFQPHKFLWKEDEAGNKRREREPVGDLIKKYYPPIVSADKFNLVQEQFKANVHKGGQTGDAHNLFVHLVKCGYCSQNGVSKDSMHYLDKGNGLRGGKYLVCDNTSRKTPESCGCRRLVRYEDFESVVLEFCRGLCPEDLQEEDSQRLTEILAMEGQLASLQADLDAKESEEQRLVNFLASGSMAPEAVEKALVTIKAEKAQLTTERDRLEREITQRRGPEDAPKTLKSIQEFIEKLHTTRGNKGRDLRQKTNLHLKKLIKRIDIFAEGLPRRTGDELYLELMEILTPADIGSRTMKQLRRFAERSPLTDPKTYLTIRVIFTTGSTRVLTPYLEGVRLASDFDLEAGTAEVFHPLGRLSSELLTPEESAAYEQQRQRAAAYLARKLEERKSGRKN